MAKGTRSVPAVSAAWRDGSKRATGAHSQRRGHEREGQSSLSVPHGVRAPYKSTQ